MEENTVGIIDNFTFSILKDIDGACKRFTDFSSSCPNETTRSKKLKELEKCGLIKQEVRRDGGVRKTITCYVLTTKGKKALDILIELSECINQ